MKLDTWPGAGRPDELSRSGAHPPRVAPTRPDLANTLQYSVQMRAAIERAMAYSWTRLPSGPR